MGYLIPKREHTRFPDIFEKQHQKLLQPVVSIKSQSDLEVPKAMKIRVPRRQHNQTDVSFRH